MAQSLGLMGLWGQTPIGVSAAPTAVGGEPESVAGPAHVRFAPILVVAAFLPLSRKQTLPHGHLGPADPAFSTVLWRLRRTARNGHPPGDQTATPCRDRLRDCRASGWCLPRLPSPRT